MTQGGAGSEPRDRRVSPRPGSIRRRDEASPGRSTSADVTVVICAYTFDRLIDTIASARSALGQVPMPAQVVLVVDHDPELLEALRMQLADEVEVVPNAGPRGLSGARNTGIALARGNVVAFLDDDATARAGWLAGLAGAFDDALVGIAGGHAEPAWDRPPPAWFPPEFLWVVGCSYEGMRREGEVRNVLGCNMAVRRGLFGQIGGFDPVMGRSASRLLGGDETELCIRARRVQPGTRVVMVEGAVVSHRVPRMRQGAGYFLRRCFHEGVSKATLRRLEGRSALESEWRYTLGTLPAGVRRNLAAAVRGRTAAGHPAQAAAIVAGLAVTTTGFLAGAVRAVFASPDIKQDAAGRLVPVAADAAGDGTGPGPAERELEPVASFADMRMRRRPTGPRTRRSAALVRPER